MTLRTASRLHPLNRTHRCNDAVPQRQWRLAAVGAVLWCFTLLASAGDPATPRNLHLSAHHLPPGFETVSVRRVLQDDQGFLWLATDRGLLRFDGSGHRLFDDGRSPTDRLSGSSINDLLQRANGELWIASNGGIDRFRPRYPGPRSHSPRQPGPGQPQRGTAPARRSPRQSLGSTGTGRLVALVCQPGRARNDLSPGRSRPAHGGHSGNASRLARQPMARNGGGVAAFRSSRAAFP